MHITEKAFFNWQRILIREVHEKFQCQWASSFRQRVEGAAEKAKNC